MQPVSLKEIQSEMLRLLQIIIRECVHHDLQYWIDSGTLLGATRHQGFIPWDDDLDISLMKSDFDVLIKALERIDSGSENALLYYGSNNCSYWSDYLASDRYVMQNYRGDLVPCHIDLFPFKALREQDIDNDKELTNTAMYLVAGKIKFPTLFDQKLRKKNRPEALRHKREWMDRFNNIHISALGSLTDDTKYLTYSFEDFPYDYIRPKFTVAEIFPLQKCQFEGLEVSQPSDPDAFLTRLYGDYMRLPPKDKRRPYHLKYYRVDVKTGMEIIDDYTARAFANFYDRHLFTTKLKRMSSTLKHSGIKELKQKITSYLRY